MNHLTCAYRRFEAVTHGRMTMSRAVVGRACCDRDAGLKGRDPARVQNNPDVRCLPKTLGFGPCTHTTDCLGFAWEIPTQGIGNARNYCTTACQGSRLALCELWLDRRACRILLFHGGPSTVALCAFAKKTNSVIGSTQVSCQSTAV